MREWSSTATCRASRPGCLYLPRRRPSPRSRDLAESRHALDIEMDQIARHWVFIAPHGWPWIEIAPAAQPGTAQDAADRGWAQPQVTGDAPSVVVKPVKSNHLFH